MKLLILLCMLLSGCAVGRGDFRIVTEYQTIGETPHIVETKDGLYSAEVVKKRTVSINARFLEHATNLEIRRDQKSDLIKYDQVGDPSPAVAARKQDNETLRNLISAVQELTAKIGAAIATGGAM